MISHTFDTTFRPEPGWLLGTSGPQNGFKHARWRKNRIVLYSMQWYFWRTLSGAWRYILGSAPPGKKVLNKKTRRNWTCQVRYRMASATIQHLWCRSGQRSICG